MRTPRLVKVGIMVGLALGPAFAVWAQAVEAGAVAGNPGPDAAVMVETPPFAGVSATLEPPVTPTECYSACACWNADGTLGVEGAVCNMMCAPKPPLEKRCPAVMPEDPMAAASIPDGDTPVSSEGGEGGAAAEPAMPPMAEPALVTPELAPAGEGVGVEGAQ